MSAISGLVLLLCIGTAFACDCGYVPKSRVYNGKEVSPAKYPWLVAVEMKFPDGTWGTCGGSILDSRHILTAAHCAFADGRAVKRGELRVKIGAHHREESPGIVLMASNVYLHHKYNYSKVTHHDMAVIELKRPLKFSSTVFPVCIPDWDDIPKYMTVAGWGKLSSDSNYTSNIPFEAEVEHISRETCDKYRFTYFNEKLGLTALTEPIHEHHLCAVNRESGSSSCPGDSGGPLMWEDPDDGRVYQIGVVSGYYKPCGSTDAPGLFTKVVEFLGFIKRYAPNVCVPE